MTEAHESFFERVDHARYQAGQAAGHYESFFQRANDPERARAFWIRYTTRKLDGAPARTEVLSTRHRAAFEILTDDRDHGVELRV